jgi:hypothetical protein
VELAILNPYAVEVRYADDWREPGREDAIEALRLAEQVRDQARKVLPSEVVAEG